MKPGIELDILIATRVMGWTASEGAHGPNQIWHDQNGRPVIAIQNFRPSEDIKDAWEVTEKLKSFLETKYDAIVLIFDKTWIAYIGDFSHGEMSPLSEYQASAATAPHAICLAALKVVERK